MQVGENMANYAILKELAPLFAKALQSETGWSLQGFGMFRFYLAPEWRLHVWDDRFRNPEGTRLHDHPWDFESFIIAGSITNHVYQKPALGQMAWSHHEQTIICGPGGHAKGQPKDVSLELVSSTQYWRGESYGQLAPQIHDTDYTRGTITLVRRTFKEDTEHARVYASFGQRWESNEPRPATKEELSVALSTALVRLISETA